MDVRYALWVLKQRIYESSIAKVFDLGSNLERHGGERKSNGTMLSSAQVAFSLLTPPSPEATASDAR